MKRYIDIGPYKLGQELVGVVEDFVDNSMII